MGVGNARELTGVVVGVASLDAVGERKGAKPVGGVVGVADDLAAVAVDGVGGLLDAGEAPGGVVGVGLGERDSGMSQAALGALAGGVVGVAETALGILDAGQAVELVVREGLSVKDGGGGAVELGRWIGAAAQAGLGEAVAVVPGEIDDAAVRPRGGGGGAVADADEALERVVQAAGNRR